jgi:hypothetical protein
VTAMMSPGEAAVTVIVSGKAARVTVRFPDGETLELRDRDHWTLMVDPAVTAVVQAWNRPGLVPAFHRAAQRRLHRTWPALAQAIERLAAR